MPGEEVPRTRSNIEQIYVPTPAVGIETAKIRLLKTVNSDTALFISGGKTPTDLYRVLAHEKMFTPRFVILGDERIDGSNQAMIEETGFVKSLEEKGIPFIGITHGEADDIERLAKVFEGKVRMVLNDPKVKKRIYVAGMGRDGHTAGLAPTVKDEGGNVLFENPIYGDAFKDSFVGYFDDEGKFGFNKRITIMDRVIKQMDEVILLLLGDEGKAEVLRELLFGPDRDYREFPVQILREMAKNRKKHTRVITDIVA